MKYIAIYLLLINAVGFLIMLADKRRAKKNRCRIPEATLLTVAALGGSVGSLLGMYLFRHKTLHLQFVAGIPAILVVQIFAAIFLIYG